MLCPRCNADIVELKLEDGSFARFCDACNWGKDALADRLNPEASPASSPSRSYSLRPGDRLRLLAGVIVSLIIALAPYVLLVHAGDWFGRDGNAWSILPSADRMAEILNPGYWIVLAIYTVIATLVTVETDRSDIGWFGGMVDIPFYWGDDINRFFLFLEFALFPGKLIGRSILGLVRYAGLVLRGKP